MMYHIIHNRTCGPLASTDDLENAGRIVHALMETREPPYDGANHWSDYWVRDDAGNEYYWSRDYRTVFSAACGEGDK